MKFEIGGWVQVDIPDADDADHRFHGETGGGRRHGGALDPHQREDKARCGPPHGRSPSDNFT